MRCKLRWISMVLDWLLFCYKGCSLKAIIALFWELFENIGALKIDPSCPCFSFASQTIFAIIIKFAVVAPVSTCVFFLRDKMPTQISSALPVKQSKYFEPNIQYCCRLTDKNREHGGGGGNVLLEQRVWRSTLQSAPHSQRGKILPATYDLRVPLRS